MPSELFTLDDASHVRMGAPETATDRKLHQFTHPDIMEICQLVMGYSVFHGGSARNTMPAHVHGRRIEACLYFDLAVDNRVLHVMGEPIATRCIVMKNRDAVISRPWSIHCGCDTDGYTFCWAMGGDNVDYRDVDMVAITELR